MKRSHLGFSVLLLFSATGCVPEFLQSKQAELCTNLVNVENAIKRFREIENSANLTSIKQAEFQIREAFRQVQSTAQEVPEVETKTSVESLETASKDLEKSVQQAPTQATNQSQVAQTAANISERVTRLESTLNEAKSRLRCPAVTQ